MSRSRTSPLPIRRKSIQMPEYLSFDSDLADLTPEEAAEQLALQREQLMKAMDRLKDADRIDPKIFECVVSV